MRHYRLVLLTMDRTDVPASRDPQQSKRDPAHDVGDVVGAQEHACGGDDPDEDRCGGCSAAAPYGLDALEH